MPFTSPTVLVVDDETKLADLYATWLSDDYFVKTANNAEQALDQLDETIDVILLDRQMPGLSGDAVLAEIRHREVTCRVAMITGVEPDFDIFNMGYDEYLTKPVSRSDLHTVVEVLLKRAQYDAAVQRYYSLLSKQASLQAKMDKDELLDHPKYQALQTEIEMIEGKLDETMANFRTADFKAQMQHVNNLNKP